MTRRYCTGYLGDIGRSAGGFTDDSVLGSSLSRRRCTRSMPPQRPRIGRILMARGLTPPTFAIVTSFGPLGHARGLQGITDEVAIGRSRGFGVAK